MRTSRGNSHDPGRQGYASGFHDGWHDAADGFDMADSNTFGKDYKKGYVDGHNGYHTSCQPSVG